MTFCTSYAIAQEVESYLPKHQMRAVWLTTIHGLDWPSKPARHLNDEARQQRELITILDRLRSTGVNTVFLQVRGRGDLIYPSDIEPLSPSIACHYRPSYDPLRFAVEECHKRGMAIHAWVVVMPLGTSRYQRALGAGAYARTHAAHTVTFHHQAYMDPADPMTAKHLRRIVGELLERYDVEGIHLDYIRYPDDGQKFPDDYRYRRSDTALSHAAWRRNCISAIVSAIHDEIRRHSPAVLLSAATIGAYEKLPGHRILWTAYDDVYQDPVQWCEGNYIDFIVPMHYTKGPNFVPIIEDWKRKVKKPIVIGLGAYRTLRNEGGWHPSELLWQTMMIQRDSLISGVCYFRADQVVGSSSLIQRDLQESLFRKPVLPPAWHSSSDSTLQVPQAPMLLELEEREDGEVSLKWQNRNMHTVLFAVYVRTDGSKPDVSSGRDLIAVTTSPEVRIAKELLPTKGTEGYIQIEVSAYDLKTGIESFSISGASLYRRAADDQN